MLTYPLSLRRLFGPIFAICLSWALPGQTDIIQLNYTHMGVAGMSFDRAGEALYFTEAGSERLMCWRFMEGSILPLEELTPKAGDLSTGYKERLAVATPDRGVIMQNINHLGEQRTLTLPEGWQPTMLALDPFSILLAVGSEEGWLGVYNARTGEQRQLLGVADAPVEEIVFGAGGKFLAAASGGWIKIWRTSDWKLMGQRVVNPLSDQGIAFHSQAAVIAMADRLSLRFYDLDNELDWRFSNITTSPIRYVAFNPQADQLAIGSQDGSIKLLHFRTGHVMVTLRQSVDGLSGLHYSPDGRWLAAGGKDGIRLFEAATGRYAGYANPLTPFAPLYEPAPAPIAQD